MRLKVIKILQCPKCGSELSIIKIERLLRDRMVEGDLLCPYCKNKFPVVNEIICFVPRELKKTQNDIEKEKKKIFKRDFDDTWKEGFSKEELKALKSEWNWMIERLNIKESKIHLDWATGTGRFLRNITKIGEGEKIALDKGYGDCLGLKELLKKLHRYKLVSIICADARKLPFKDNSVDTISSWHGLDERKMEDAIRESKRILKRNGKIALTGIFYKEKSKSFQRAIKWKINFAKEGFIFRLFKKLGFKNIEYRVFFEGVWKEKNSYLPVYGDWYAVYGIYGEKE